jgi:drug/metabolite transporter (DMT)-like permease
MDGRIIGVLAIVCFSVSNSMFRKVERAASPSQINAFRTTLGAITFVIIAAVMGLFADVAKFSYKIWLLLFASVLFAQVLGDTFYFQAQKRLGTTKALAISMTFPLLTFFLSVIILNSTIPYIFYIAAVLIIGGVLLIAKSQEQMLKKAEEEEEEEEFSCSEENEQKKNRNYIVWIAVGIGFLAAISWAVGIVLTDWVLNDISTLLGTEATSSLLGNAVRFPFAASVLISWAWRTPQTKIKTWNKKTWIWLLVASVIGTSAGAYLFAEGTRSAGAEVMSLIAASSPLFALPVTWFLNKEKINLLGFMGVILTIVGVVLILV